MEHDDDIDRYASIYIALEEAFDELHAAVLARIGDPKHRFSQHHDYPKLAGRFDSGFPHFSELGYHAGDAPTDYTGTFLPKNFLIAFTSVKPSETFPKQSALIDKLQSDTELASRYHFGGMFSGYEIDRVVSAAVERYLHTYGLDAIDHAKRRRVLRPFFQGLINEDYDLKVIVPITLTGFEPAFYRLSESSYIIRIPKRLQLARWTIKPFGTGAVSTVIGAATHAFVSKGWNWSINGYTLSNLRDSLNDPGKNVLDEVDLFFAALRAATGVKTGYAQLLMYPRRWALDCLADLPAVYGATYRRYPNSFDRHGWIYEGDQKVTREQMASVKRLYNLIKARKEERIEIALKRLNACMSRDDPVDAVLDATIGLEVLLGDKENQALSYKLRIRAAGLARLRGDRKPSEVAAAIKAIYEARSGIVHGLSSRKDAKKLKSVPEEERFVQERGAAAEMLRYVLDILLEHPQYLDPLMIDTELLMGQFNPLSLSK